MRINFYSMIVAAVMLSVAMVSKAEKVIQIHSNDETAAAVEIALTNDVQVKFAEGNMNVVEAEGEQAQVFDLRSISKITFGEASAIEEVEAASALVVAPNPVRDNLVIKGGQDLYGNAVNIFSVQGKRVMTLSAWQGEAINVSGLSAGIYFLNIQSKTVKIIKI